MNTLTQPRDSGTDPLPPRGTIPYFRAVLDREAALRGLPPEPWKGTDWPPELRYMTPRRRAEWAALLEWAAAERGLDPDPWVA
jgi:hypothetical protein